MPRSANHPQQARWAFLDHWLREGRQFTAPVAAAALEVSDRTIRTDLNALAEWGVPVAWDARQGSYVLTAPYAGLPLLPMTGADFAAFLVARHALEALGDTHTADTLALVADRLATHLPAQIRVAPESLAHHLRFTGDPATAPRPQWQMALKAALDAHRVVTLRYRSASKDELTERHAEPYALVRHAGRWYLVAYDYTRDAWRDFRLDRIEALQVTPAVFAGRPFDLDAYLGSSFGMHRGDRTYSVHLRFSAYQARWIREEQWHPSQVRARRHDGTLDLRMQVQGLEDLVRWVLSYGGEVEVLAPAELRRRVAHEAQRMTERYASPAAQSN